MKMLGTAEAPGIDFSITPSLSGLSHQGKSNKAGILLLRWQIRRDCLRGGSMLLVATNLLDAESNVKVSEREKFLEEKVPPLELPYSRDELLDKQLRDAGDWRKNIEDKSDRKKMFDS
ncbi:hypothetical protein F7725_023442 [Dissostichus mawsoni]|uniref:Uncharacterized protein n=1 Tax=Dissostichus mawsoni TaxID=36200 RepID=A0A7J5Z3M7_DISMA|nr:hypothetical protein F7725_023442 [Dissostichus mawsoni]